MRRAILVSVCGSMIVLLAGCASLGADNKSLARDETLGQYGSALRFGDFASAWQFVDPKVREAHPLNAAAKARYKQVEVGNYVTEGPVPVDENTVQQVVQITLVIKSSQASYDVIDHQTWKYDPAGKHWWLETGLPDITPQQ
ncbi:MAG TPA: hypothetical protein VJ727_11000 [Rhodanobacteraceae bacterium]|nr:hypothetical protein [Rhodanobacteraceae bacterium]